MYLGLLQSIFFVYYSQDHSDITKMLIFILLINFKEGVNKSTWLNFQMIYWLWEQTASINPYISTALCILFFSGLSTYVGLYGSGLFNFGYYVNLPTLFACFLGFDVPTFSFIFIQNVFYLLVIMNILSPHLCLLVPSSSLASFKFELNNY